MAIKRRLSPYSKYVDELTAEDISELSHIKRFLECFGGDKDFREEALSGERSLEDLAAERGCFIMGLDSLRPVFDPDFAHFRADATPETWPLTAKWDEYFLLMRNTLEFYKWEGDSKGWFPEFDKWRSSQIVRTFVEVGPSSASLVHPAVAFELSDGCSVGCWFCGISAEKFKGHFALDGQGKEFWREILESVQNLLGSAINTGFCYWATEPLDHPDYDQFIDEYFDVTGVMPQTTTAIPLKNVELTRKVLERWSKSRYLVNRFSILTTKIMRRVHSEFTAEELFGVELVLQGKDSLVPKSTAGKAYASQGKILDKKKFDNMQDGTIACVTGFLINLPKKTVRLVSPTLPSEDWPNGYYVFSSKKFETPKDLHNKMRNMVKEQIDRRLKGNQNVKVADGHWFEGSDGQYRVRDKKSGFSVEVFDVYAPLIKAGNVTPNTLLKEAIKAGYDPISAMKVLNDLNAMGLIGDSLKPPKGITESMMQFPELN